MHQQLRSGRGSAVKVVLQRMRRGIKSKTSPPPDQKHLTPSDAADTSSWLCVRRRKNRRSSSSKNKYEVEVYHPIQTISRSSDGRFVLENSPPPRQSHSYYPGHPVSVAPLNIDDPIDTPHEYTLPPNGHYQDFNIPQDYLSRRHNTKEATDSVNKRDSFSKRPQVPKDYLTRGNNVHPPSHFQSPPIRSPANMRSPGVASYHTPLGAGWYEDSYFQQGKSPYRFGAWRERPPTTPTTPRDGVLMRPNATPSNQTYLTSSPDQNASNTTPFVISDVSSVNPSFSTNGERSHSGHGNIVISDSSIGHDFSGDNNVHPPGVHQWNYPLPGDYYRQVRNLAGQYGHPLDSPGSAALYQIPESQGSSPIELTYTRDHLDKAIQKVRAGHTPQGSMDSNEPVNNVNVNTKPSANAKPAADNFRTSVAPYKNYVLSGSTSSSGVGSGTAAGGPRMPVYQRHLSSPNSSGIGSRENSHSTGSVSHAAGEPWDPGHAVTTPLTPSNLDAIARLDDHLNEWYRQTPTRQHHPDPRRDYKDYADSQERCQRLREEYLAFQQSQHSGDKLTSQGSYVHEMESEML